MIPFGLGVLAWVFWLGSFGLAKKIPVELIGKQKKYFFIKTRLKRIESKIAR